MGYTKLFNEIVMSTIWQEPNHVRIVWVTMLALKDRWHRVNASIPGLAVASQVSIEECEDAINRLSSPDPYSRSTAFEGRRIEKIEGGWTILNGETYRNKMSLDERREYNRIKQKEYRTKKKASKKCVQNSTECTHTDTDTETDTYNNSTNVELSSSSDDAGADKSAPCPHQKIIDLYHKHCPDLPRVRTWEGARRQNLRQRWMKADNLEWWEWFFKVINTLDFYNGREPGKTWRCNLDWIVKHSNFQKLVEICHERVEQS